DTATTEIYTLSLHDALPILAITLVPALMTVFLRGRLRPESENPISRISQAIYLPVLKVCLRFPKVTLLLNLTGLAATLPGISIGQATRLMQEQDRVIRSFPEVESVFGSIGRSDSATDNAPLDMYDTTVTLKPPSQWPKGMTQEKLIAAMDDKLHFPGLSNTWTMPIENRLDMELTGIKTPVGIKLQGPTLEGIQSLGAQIQQILGASTAMRSIFSERVAEGFYINIAVNRMQAARYGLPDGDVQRVLTSAIGAENVA